MRSLPRRRCRQSRNPVRRHYFACRQPARTGRDRSRLNHRLARRHAYGPPPPAGRRGARHSKPGNTCFSKLGLAGGSHYGCVGGRCHRRTAGGSYGRAGGSSHGRIGDGSYGRAGGGSFGWAGDGSHGCVGGRSQGRGGGSKNGHTCGTSHRRAGGCRHRYAGRGNRRRVERSERGRRHGDWSWASRDSSRRCCRHCHRSDLRLAGNPGLWRRQLGRRQRGSTALWRRHRRSGPWQQHRPRRRKAWRGRSNRNAREDTRVGVTSGISDPGWGHSAAAGVNCGP